MLMMDEPDCSPIVLCTDLEISLILQSSSYWCLVSNNSQLLAKNNRNALELVALRSCFCISGNKVKLHSKSCIALERLFAENCAANILCQSIIPLINFVWIYILQTTKKGSNFVVFKSNICMCKLIL